MEWSDLQRGARNLLVGSDPEAIPKDVSVPQAGDKYFEARPPHHVWIVSKVYQPPSSRHPHVLLDRCGKFPASKLLSSDVLQNTSFFRRDRRDPFADDIANAKARRRTDSKRGR